MIYRIRYQQPDAPGAGEFVVEANSPTEAMVKFQHTRDNRSAPDWSESVVTSVRAEDACDELIC